MVLQVVAEPGSGSVQMNIAIVDADEVLAKALKSLLESQEGVGNVTIYTSPSSAKADVDSGKINAVFVDPFAFGKDGAAPVLEATRTRVPVCLYASASNLAAKPHISAWWGRRLDDYYRLPKEAELSALTAEVSHVLRGFSQYLRRRLAQSKLKELKDAVGAEHGTALNAKIVEAAQVASEVIEADESTRTPVLADVLPTKKLQSLIEDTIEKASKSINTTVRINIGILIFGSGLIIASFVFAMLRNKSIESVAFGSFGLAGIVTSLVMNPLKAIGHSARKLTQIQVAYFTFFNQLSMLNRGVDATNVAERTKSLGEQMDKIMEALQKYFDDSPAK